MKTIIRTIAIILLLCTSVSASVLHNIDTLEGARGIHIDYPQQYNVRIFNDQFDQTFKYNKLEYYDRAHLKNKGNDFLLMNTNVIVSVTYDVESLRVLIGNGTTNGVTILYLGNVPLTPQIVEIINEKPSKEISEDTPSIEDIIDLQLPLPSLSIEYPEPPITHTIYDDLIDEHFYHKVLPLFLLYDE